MKILVSTKAMAKLLDQIPEGEFVERVNLDEGQLILISQTKSVKTSVHIIKFEASLKQEDRRWDWVHHLMRQVNEQPVGMDIREGGISVIFQY